MTTIPTAEAPLPMGKIGLLFETDGNVPTIVDILPDSPLIDTFEIGDSFEMLTLGSGVMIEDLETRELVEYLQKTSNDPERKLKMCIVRRREE
eukprot:CAMPEP_0194206370 /NCGR_PEP_ID=MMETSP0156-20130528/5431_1 /TAXON_ID=33649 /ORGANISM="Thalassionema nitzschioides, Strain L26-B" /LENGTH=92 /DNA_ID=CAMNT_0038932889 /DNA_START=35 /DNA_END=313 /DNA_ORIENTATION=-